jgi:hypothetical protein
MINHCIYLKLKPTSNQVTKYHGIYSMYPVPLSMAPLPFLKISGGAAAITLQKLRTSDPPSARGGFDFSFSAENLSAKNLSRISQGMLKI